MHQARNVSSGRASDEVATQSGNVLVADDERVYISAGDVVADKYLVERLLGVGGMGFVVAARHVQLEGAFALKFLKKRFSKDSHVVDRFTREARAACRIRSDYVARVFDVGSYNGAPFLVMEHLVGRDLSEVVAEHGRLHVEEAVEYVIQACAALAAAHACGVVHRDIKPENLFLVENEGLSTIKLLDFGISRVVLTGLQSEPHAARLTGALTLGTPLYMSPEQIRSTASAGTQSDLWSLGVVLYELLTGGVPFLAEGVGEICAAILEKEPPQLADVRPDAPDGLAEVVARCLRKDPSERFRNVSELAVALLPFAPSRSLAVAESSSAIRRAAIEAAGFASEVPARTTAKSLRSISLRLPDSTTAGRTSAPGTIDAPPSGFAPQTTGAAQARRRQLAFLGVGVGVVAIAGAAALALSARSAPPPGAPHDGMANLARPNPSAGLSPQGPPAAARPDDRPSPTTEPVEPRQVKGAGAVTRSAPPPRWTPPAPALRVAPPPVPRSTAQPNAPPSEAAAAVVDVPVAPRPMTGGRPDLGY